MKTLWGMTQWDIVLTVLIIGLGSLALLVITDRAVDTAMLAQNNETESIKSNFTVLDTLPNEGAGDVTVYHDSARNVTIYLWQNSYSGETQMFVIPDNQLNQTGVPCQN